MKSSSFSSSVVVARSSSSSAAATRTTAVAAVAFAFAFAASSTFAPFASAAAAAGASSSSSSSFSTMMPQPRPRPRPPTSKVWIPSIPSAFCPPSSSSSSPRRSPSSSSSFGVGVVVRRPGERRESTKKEGGKPSFVVVLGLAKKKAGGGGGGAKSKKKKSTGGGGFGFGFGGGGDPKTASSLSSSSSSSSSSLPGKKIRSVGGSGSPGSGTKALRSAANAFDAIRGAHGKECASDVYVRSPSNDRSTFWFVGKIARRPDVPSPPTEREAALSQKRLILEYAKSELRPQNFGGPHSKDLELWLAPGDSEMDVVRNKVALRKVVGSMSDLSDAFRVVDVGYNPEIYVGDEKREGGLRVVRDEEGRPTKDVFEINQ